jgi:hypothetical protein
MHTTLSLLVDVKNLHLTHLISLPAGKPATPFPSCHHSQLLFLTPHLSHVCLPTSVGTRLELRDVVVDVELEDTTVDWELGHAAVDLELGDEEAARSRARRGREWRPTPDLAQLSVWKRKSWGSPPPRLSCLG